MSPLPRRSEPTARGLSWVRALLEDVAAWHGITPADIVGPSHERACVRARREIAMNLHCFHGWPIRFIGHLLGARHPSTVRYWLRTAKRRPDPEAV